MHEIGIIVKTINYSSKSCRFVLTISDILIAISSAEPTPQAQVFLWCNMTHFTRVSSHKSMSRSHLIGNDGGTH